MLKVNGDVALMMSRTHRRMERAAAEPVAAASETADEVASTEQRVEGTTDARKGHHHGRSHVQQSLHRLERLVTDRIEAEIEAGDLDEETVESLKALMWDFHSDLQDAFHASGRGHGFDRSELLSEIGDAVTALTEALAALRGEDEVVVDDPEATESPEIVPTPAVDPTERTTDGETAVVEPGGLLEAEA